MITKIKTFIVILSLSCGAHIFATSLSVDPSFSPPRFVVPESWIKVAVQPDGKILRCLAGVTQSGLGRNTLLGQDSGPIVRYLADGTLDSTFNFTSRDYPFVQTVAAQADGKILIAAGQGDVVTGVNEVGRILRLNSDGSIDGTFDSSVTTNVPANHIVTAADGKILIAGAFSTVNGQSWQGIARLNSNGGIDSSFGPVTMTPSPTSPSAAVVNGAPVIQPDGNILIVGLFNSVNGVARASIARLNSDGSLDTTFVPTGVQATNNVTNYRSIILRADGKIILPGRFTVPASFASNPTGLTYNRLPMLLLNPNGTVDQSFGYFGTLNFSFGSASAVFGRMRDLQVAPDGSLVGLGSNGMYRFNSDGSLNSYLAIITASDGSSLSVGVNRLVVQSDGQTLAAGGFTNVVDNTGTNRARKGLFRIALDGTIDSLDPTATGIYTTPASFFRRGDGTTLIAFNQGSYDDVPGGFAIPHNLGRLNADGSIDTSFDPIASFPISGPLTNFIATGFNLLSDGNLFLFTSDAITVDLSSFGYGRMSQSGTLDPSFGDGGFDGAQYITQPDGATLALIGGDANLFQTGEVLRRIAPDNSTTAITIDGAIVAAMNQVIGGVTTRGQSARIVGVLNDGRILFSYLASDSTYHLVRLNNDGTLDPTFQEGITQAFGVITFPSGAQNLLTAQPAFTDAIVSAGGAAVITGYFVNYNGVPQHGIVRLNNDGTIDSNFHSGGGAQWTQTVETASNHPSIDNIEPQNDGGFLITGTFEAFDGAAAPGIANLKFDGTFDSSFVAPVARDNIDPTKTNLGVQQDGSFLLSGPYHLPNQTLTPSFVRLVAPPGAVTTPLGNNVPVTIPPVGSTGINLTFPSVILDGVTNVTSIDPASAGALPPGGYQLAGTNLGFEINTTAHYTAPLIVAFHVPSVDAATFAQLRVLHNDGSGLVDVTANNPAPDPATQTIYAQVNSLSPFVLATRPLQYQAQIQPPINADGSSVFTVKRGVAPIKFTLTLGGKSTCTLPPATIAVSRTAGGSVGSVNESTFIMPADSGSNFRKEGCQYGYNLNSGGLGAGTYRVDIKINGQVVGSATFKLN